MEKNIIQSRWRSWAKRGGIVLLVIIVILLFIQILFTVFAESFVKQKMVSAIEHSDSSLKARIENLSLFTLKRQIRVEGIRIWRPDSTYSDTTQEPPFLDSLSVKSVTVNGVQLYNLFFGDKLAIRHLSVNAPRLYAFKAQKSSQTQQQKKNINAKLYEKLKSRFKSLRIDDFSIRNFSATLFKTPSSESPMTEIHNFSIHFSGIKLDSAWAQQHPLLPSETFWGSVDSLRWLDSKLYHFKTGHTWFSSQDSSVAIDSIALEPQLSMDQFAKSVGHEIDRIYWQTGHFQITALNFPKLIEDRRFKARKISIGDTKLNIFHDKRPPGGPTKKHEFPHLLFRRLDFPTAVDSVSVSNADIAYSEHKNLVPEAGTVTFENTDAIIQHLYNRAYADSLSQTISMHAESDIMGVGHLDAQFTFPDDTSGTHHIKGNIGGMPMKSLNQAVENLGSVHIESGQIHSINFDMELGPVESTGSLYLHYTDLKIKIIEFDGIADKDQKKLKSFIANNFVIKKNNKPPLREASISFERVIEKSIFNYWWKSLLSGLKSSVGL